MVFLWFSYGFHYGFCRKTLDFNGTASVTDFPFKNRVISGSASHLSDDIDIDSTVARKARMELGRWAGEFLMISVADDLDYYFYGLKCWIMNPFKKIQRILYDVISIGLFFDDYPDD